MLTMEIINKLRQWNDKEITSALKDGQTEKDPYLRGFAHGKVNVRVGLDVLLSKYEEVFTDEEVIVALKFMMEVFEEHLSTTDLTYWFEDISKEYKGQVLIDAHSIAYERLEKARDVIIETFGL